MRASSPSTSSSSTRTRRATPSTSSFRSPSRVPGTVIIADNVVRKGEVANPQSADPRVQGVRRFLELAAADERLRGTAVQTVGSKGYDGFALFVVAQP